MVIMATGRTTIAMEGKARESGLFCVPPSFLLGKSGPPPAGHVPIEERHVPVTEGPDQSLGKLGTRSVLAGHHQCGPLVGRDARQPQQDLPGRGMDRAGYVAGLELDAAPDIEDHGRLFPGKWYTPQSSCGGRSASAA